MSLLDKFEPIDFVALFSLGMFGVLTYCGINGSIQGMMYTIIGWYFGRKAT